MTPQPRRRRPTQVDIARAAGVSQATVSLVINKAPSASQVAPETRARVMRVIAELGYAANPAARNLKGRRNHLLGLYTFESVFPVDQRDFYYPFLLGVEEEAAAQGYDLLLFTSAGTAGARSIYTGGVNRLKAADGCVLLGRHLRREDLARLVQEDFPFVFIGRREVPGAELSYVAADYVTATREIVARLVGLRHSRILYLEVPDGAEPTRDRETGYRLGLADAGLPAGAALVHPLADPAGVTPELLRGWLASGVTAIVVEPTEDDRALAAVEAAARAAGVEIPRDCSVALLGDPPSLDRSARDWTRFTLPRARMGAEAVRLLVNLLDDEPATGPRQLLVPCGQLPGETVGPALGGPG
jgi:DNA-binding LacI/PurR family transcriptional regulator